MADRMEFIETLNHHLHEQAVRWFSAREACPVGRKSGVATLQEAPRGLWPNAVRTLLLMDRLRDHLDQPVIVRSGYRDEAYNRAVGGSAGSLHLDFAAFDIVSPSTDPLTIARWFNAQPESETLGIGLYRTFVHVDTRGALGRPAPARWSFDEDQPDWWLDGGADAA